MKPYWAECVVGHTPVLERDYAIQCFGLEDVRRIEEELPPLNPRRLSTEECPDCWEALQTAN